MADENKTSSDAEERQRREAQAAEHVHPPHLATEEKPPETKPELALDDGLEIPHLREPAPGTAPGIEHEQLAAMPNTGTGQCHVTVIDYTLDKIQVTDVTDIEDFLV